MRTNLQKRNYKRSIVDNKAKPILNRNNESSPCECKFGLPYF
jgi:hypothetical protein